MDVLDMAEENRATAINTTLTSITSALHDKFTFGITTCVDCGETISAIRKQRLPSAIRCIECQRLYEGEKSNGR